MGQAARWLGRLGGHLGGKGDGLPGVRTPWRGWRDLAVLVAGDRAGKARPAWDGEADARQKDPTARSRTWIAVDEPTDAGASPEVLAPALLV
jgi:hypothetical protein